MSIALCWPHGLCCVCVCVDESVYLCADVSIWAIAECKVQRSVFEYTPHTSNQASNVFGRCLVFGFWNRICVHNSSGMPNEYGVPVVVRVFVYVCLCLNGTTRLFWKLVFPMNYCEKPIHSWTVCKTLPWLNIGERLWSKGKKTPAKRYHQSRTQLDILFSPVLWFISRFWLSLSLFQSNINKQKRPNGQSE